MSLPPAGLYGAEQTKHAWEPHACIQSCCQRRTRAPPSRRTAHSRPAVPQSMAPKQMQQAPTSSGAAWIEATGRRLQHFGDTVDALAAKASAPPPAPTSGTRAGAQMPWPAPPQAPASGSSATPPSYGVVPPKAPPATPQEEFSMLRITERSAMGFAVARRAVMIQGRPVVAPRGGFQKGHSWGQKCFSCRRFAKSP